MDKKTVVWVVEVRHGWKWVRKEYKRGKSAIAYAIKESESGADVTVWEYDADNKLVTVTDM